MAIGGIGQSGFYPAQAAAQYSKNAPGGFDDTGKMAQARKDASKDAASVAADKPSPLGVPPAKGTPTGQSADTEAQKPATASASSAGAVVYDPRDTNRDGKVSLQEELAYAVKQYSAKSVNPGKTGGNRISTTNGVTGQEARSFSINLQA